VDTNLFVSAVIFPNSIPRQAVDRALDRDVLLLTQPSLNELREVLTRAQFDRYVETEERMWFLAELESVAELVPIIQFVRECRDPSDDEFLEVELNGRADVIITGDADLLEMNPWREIEILSLADYLRSPN
jgi:putative PIN family toxin of toxin-antitoxin system